MSDTGTQTQVGRVAFSWIVVAVPLLYGIVQTLIEAAKLFTG